jgi:hypothetical protein
MERPFKKTNNFYPEAQLSRKSRRRSRKNHCKAQDSLDSSTEMRQNNKVVQTVFCVMFAAASQEFAVKKLNIFKKSFLLCYKIEKFVK